jgi:hypothetical protein
VECRPPSFFAVEVGARAALEKSEAILQGRQLAEPVGDARTEPTVHSRADAAQHGATKPGLAQKAI